MNLSYAQAKSNWNDRQRRHRTCPKSLETPHDGNEVKQSTADLIKPDRLSLLCLLELENGESVYCGQTPKQGELCHIYCLLLLDQHEVQEPATNIPAGASSFPSCAYEHTRRNQSAVVHQASTEGIQGFPGLRPVLGQVLRFKL